MTPKEIEELIAALQLNRHDIVLEAVLVAKVKDMETGATGLSMSATDDTDWVSQLGMLRGGEVITTADVRKSFSGEDD